MPAPGTTEGHRSRQRGSATVEMALLLPLVAGIVFGFLDLGRAYRLKTSLTNAAHEGAAYARFNPAQVAAVGDCADPNNVVFATNHEQGTSKGYTVTVQHTAQADDPATWTPLTGCSSVVGGRVIVTASAPFQLMTPMMSAIVGKTIILKESSEVVVQ